VSFVTGNEWFEDLRNGETFPDWGVNEIHDVCIFVHRESSVTVRSTSTERRRTGPTD